MKGIQAENHEKSKRNINDRYAVLKKTLSLYVMAYLDNRFKRLKAIPRHIILGIGICVSATGIPQYMSAQVSITGDIYPPISITPEASTGLSAIYVLHSCQGSTSLTYHAKNTSHPIWYTFGQLGAAYAEPIPENKIDYSGAESILNEVRSDCGYVIEDGNSRTYFWIIDYSEYELLLSSLSVDGDSDCYTTILNLGGDAYPIYYYTITGRRGELSREMSLKYTTMEYSADYQGYREIEATVSLPNADGAIHCTAALCDTEYTLVGDRFLREWGLPELSVSTDVIAARRVEAHTSAEQETETFDNQQRTSSGEGSASLGGSAPVEVSFIADVTPAAIFTEWQVSTHPEFEDILLRDKNLSFTRTFRDAGTTYVRFMAADADGECEHYSEIYQINIGESDLHCPNAFSPEGSPGINDEWKVSYRSITEFKCSIFNRWGICVATLDHPSQGWDGKYKGKYVGSGVYYYVIKARGADGRVYNLKGDINIIKYNNENQGIASPQQP